MSDEKDLQQEPKQKQSDRIEQLEKQVTELLKAKESQAQALVAKSYKSLAKIMCIEERPVVGIGQAREVGNGVMSIKLEVLKADGTVEPKEMDYTDMMTKVPRFMVEVLHVEKMIKETHQGPIPMKIHTRPSDEVNRKTSTGDVWQPATVLLAQTIVTARAKIKFLEGPLSGEILEVDASCLNP